MNGLDYVRRDIEGSDSDTRRRTTVDLIKGLCVLFQNEITAILLETTNGMLAEYAAHPASRWQAKDAALHILLALSVRQQTVAAGVVQLNPNVNIGEFFTTHVMPELLRPDVNALPVLKADALKFVTVFRAQLPLEAYVSLLPLLIAHLQSTEFVVHTYAAHTIDMLLKVKDGGVARLHRGSVQPFVGPLLSGLFGALRHAESTENEYVMKSIMRVCTTVKSDVAPHLVEVLQLAAKILGDVAKNPRSPGFNHFLFETIACLIKHVCEADASAVAHFETFLVPHFTAVLVQEHCIEFAPYVYQILAQLLEFRADAASGPYRAMFPSLLVPAVWENHGAIPALVRLLRSYIRRDAAHVVQANLVSLTLGVFQKLLVSKANDHHGLALLGAVFEFMPDATLQQFISPILSTLFQRQMSSPTEKYSAHLVLALATFVHARGFALLEGGMNAVQPGIFAMVLDKIWIPHCVKINGSSERQVCALGSIDLLCRSPGLSSNPAYLAKWYVLRGGSF